MIILIDVDDVLLNTCEVWINILNKKYHTAIKYSDVRQWDISKCFPQLTKNQLYKPLLSKTLWKNVKPLESSIHVLKYLKDAGNDIYLVTATDCRNISMKYKYAIKKYFPFIDQKNIIVAQNKHLIKGDMIIDDNIDNLNGRDKNEKKIIFDTPHNRDVRRFHIDKDVIRVTCWSDFLFKYENKLL